MKATRSRVQYKSAEPMSTEIIQILNNAKAERLCCSNNRQRPNRDRRYEKEHQIWRVVQSCRAQVYRDWVNNKKTATRFAAQYKSAEPVPMVVT